MFVCNCIVMECKKESVLVYCDGACSNNPGVGGWGAVLIWEGRTKEIYGAVSETTNNRMELTAAIEGLKAVTRDFRITVYTDSTYLKEGITNWIHRWKQSNWKNGKIKNIDLWEKLDSLTSEMDVDWIWVRGHSGDTYNELADKLAKKAIAEFVRNERKSLE